MLQRLKTLLAFKPRDVPFRVALRGTLGIMLPLTIGVLLGQSEIGLLVATGALNTMFADQPGPYRLRMLRMLFVAATSGLSALAGYLLADHPLGLLLAAPIWGFGGGMLVALGLHAARAGVTSMIVLVVMAGTTVGQSMSLDVAVGSAVLMFAGGVLQTLFAVAAWPLQRYRPERLALSNICRQMGRYARNSTDSNLAPPLTQALVDLQELLQAHRDAHNRSIDVLRIMAELQERIRIELLALTDLYGSVSDPYDKACVRRMLNVVARILMRTGRALRRDIDPDKARGMLRLLDRASQELETAAAETEDYADHRRLVIAHDRAVSLSGQLRSLVRYAAFVGGYGELRLEESEARLPEALRPSNPFAILFANLTLSSVACKHALRCALVLTIAVACELVIGLEHGYWIPMTAVIVLKPDYASTVSFSLWRMAGTLTGLVLITLLVHFAFSSDGSRLLLLTVLCFAYRIVLTQHYGVGVALLTGEVVVMLSFYGQSPTEVFNDRAAYTIFGSLLGLCIYLLWPTWERRQIRPELASLLEAYQTYVMVLLKGKRSSWARARSAARSARTNAEASLDRLHQEPQRDKRLTSMADGIMANTNRLIRAAMSLEAALQNHEDLPEPKLVNAFAISLEHAMQALIDSVQRGSAPEIGDLRAEERKLSKSFDILLNYAEDEQVFMLLDTCDRLTNSINTIAHLLRQEAETHLESKQEGTQVQEA